MQQTKQEKAPYFAKQKMAFSSPFLTNEPGTIASIIQRFYTMSSQCRAKDHAVEIASSMKTVLPGLFQIQRLFGPSRGLYHLATSS
jgi:hypothetical protein